MFLATLERFPNWHAYRNRNFDADARKRTTERTLSLAHGKYTVWNDSVHEGLLDKLI